MRARNNANFLRYLLPAMLGHFADAEQAIVRNDTLLVRHKNISALQVFVDYPSSMKVAHALRDLTSDDQCPVQLDLVWRRQALSALVVNQIV